MRILKGVIPVVTLAGAFLAVAFGILATASFAQAAGESASAVVDFDAAMKGLNFNPTSTDGNAASSAPNGILDADEMALVSAIIANTKLDLSKSGGVRHADVATALAEARASATEDMKPLASQFPTAADVAAGYAMLGEASLQSFARMSAGFGAPLKGDYSKAKTLGQFLAFDGDADGDGVKNVDEYKATIAKGRSVYLAAALDPQVKPTAQEIAKASPPVAPGKKIVGVVLYPGFEALDVFGPVEMWSYVPGFEVVMIAETAGPVQSAQKSVQTVAAYSFETAPKIDIVMVPGGAGTRAELNNPRFLEFLQKADQTSELTTSVCTGSALLAQAGLLKGRKATSNKAFFSLAVDADKSVDWQGKARWVEDGKYVTSSGVSAGTDMALAVVARYYGKEHTGHLAHSLEYVWNDNPDDDPFAITFGVK